MAHGRGEYRGIHTVILDGKDFQALTQEARWLYIVIRLSTGSTGIDVVPAMLPTLEERSGLPRRRVEAAMRELQSREWADWEGNILWAIRGLEFEPSLHPTNPKHVAGVVRHLDGLPRVELLGRFRSHYARWFGVGPGEPMASDSHKEAIPKAMPSREEGEGIQDTEKGKKGITPAAVAAFEKAWLAYPRRPNNSKADAMRAWEARVRDGCDCDAMITGTVAYAAYCQREGTPPQFIKRAATFFGPGRHWEADFGSGDDLVCITGEDGTPTRALLDALGVRAPA